MFGIGVELYAMFGKASLSEYRHSGNLRSAKIRSAAHSTKERDRGGSKKVQICVTPMIPNAVGYSIPVEWSNCVCKRSEASGICKQSEACGI